MFEAGIINDSVQDLNIELDDFQLRDDNGDKKRPLFASIGGVVPPARLDSGGLTIVLLVFEVEAGAEPTEFRYYPSGALKNAKFILDR